MTGVPRKRMPCEETETRGEHNVKIRAVLLQAKELPAAGRTAWNGASLQPLEGGRSCPHFDL